MDGYLDRELDPISSQTIEQHLRDCPNCDQAYKAHGSLMRAVANGSPYHKAPAGLRERIQSSLREEIGEEPVPNQSRPTQWLHLKPRDRAKDVLSATPWNWLALAAAIIVAAIITFNVMPGLRSGADQVLATQLIASHVRSLMANHLTDVASSDQHTVKPWLDTKLDFAPAVPDLSSTGFPLIGGRLDYLDNRPVAALIYQRRKHFINLFVWPIESNAAKATQTISRQGYHLLHWVDSDFNYWAISDVSPDDLQTFKLGFEEQTHPR
jgi:anti-sigma factor RsiW